MAARRVWLVLLCFGLALLAIFAVSQFTYNAVRTWDRYTVAFADIDCVPPPGQARGSFLAEVQYISGMPNQLSILDENLAARLAEAFAQHPRVDKVEKVVLLSTRQVQVRLRFRMPAAADHRSLPPEELP